MFYILVLDMLSSFMKMYWNVVIGESVKLVKLIKSKDGKIRSAKVDVISKDKIMTLKRPINNLFLVEFSTQKNIELNFVNEKDILQVVVGAGVSVS